MSRADSDSDLLSSLFRPPVVIIANSQHLSLEDLRNAVRSYVALLFAPVKDDKQSLLMVPSYPTSVALLHLN